MNEITILNNTLQSLLEDPFNKNNWVKLKNIISDCKNKQFRLELLLNKSFTYSLINAKHFDIDNFKKGALNLQAFELVNIIKSFDDVSANSNENVIQSSVIKEFAFNSLQQPQNIYITIPDNAFLFYFISNIIKSRQPDYSMIFNYLKQNPSP